MGRRFTAHPGNWERASHNLNLDELSIAALEYTLPQNWRQLWLDTLPDWLSDVTVSKFTANRNLIIDISRNSRGRLPVLKVMVLTLSWQKTISGDLVGQTES